MLAVGSRGDVEPYCSLIQKLLSCNNNVFVADNVYDFDHDDDKHQSHLFYEYHIDIFLQQNLTYMVQPYISNPRFKLHELPFASNDFHSVPHKEYPNNPDPIKMKNVCRLADIITGLILPCTKHIYETITVTAAVADDDDDDDDSSSFHSSNINTVIITSAMTRNVALLIGMKLNIPVLLLHLQPLMPNKQYPSYRTMRREFVEQCCSKRIDEVADTDETNKSNNENSIDYEETYWRIEYVLEECLLKEYVMKEWKMMLETLDDGQDSSITSDDKDNNLYSVPSSQSYWSKLQRILTGKHPNVWIVNAYSNELIPKLVDEGPNVYEVGPLADSYIPPDFDSSKYVSLLDRFLQQGSVNKPICIGFGSMPFRQDVKIVLEAIRVLNVRAILIGNDLYVPQTHLMAKEGQIVWFPSIPYSYILPKCSMMICHGGIGVVQACLYAGIPCLVSPLMGDQLALSELLDAKKLGVRIGGRDGKLSNLTSHDIVEAVTKVLLESNDVDGSDDVDDHNIIKNCYKLGKKIRQERASILQNDISKKESLSTGVDKFVQILEQHIL